MHEDGFQFRPKEQIRTVSRDEKRLNAHAVASQHQALARCRPQRDGEHPPQPRETLRVPFEERLQHRFRVRAGAKLMAAPFQLRAQLGVIVYLAVEHDHRIAALGNDGLVAGIQVDNLQPRCA